jgi:dynein heavy chain
LQGNCLLVGVGGSGKQSLARLAAYAAGCGVFEITLTRGYDEAAFREDLKALYTMLGAENKKMVFLFTDSHVADEGFLELINNMLTTGAASRHTALCIQQLSFVRSCWAMIVVQNILMSC